MNKAEYYRKYRQTEGGKAARKRARQKSLAQNKERLAELKEASPCADCGQHFPSVCMDYDHLRDKTKGVTLMVNTGYSWGRVLEEIEKCELVCANCHRLRTRDRMVS